MFGHARNHGCSGMQRVENVATWTTATANAFENYNEAVNYVKYPDDEILFISESSFSFLKPPFNLIF